MTTATAPTALRRGGNRAKEESKKRASYGYWDYLDLAKPDKGQLRGGSTILRLVTDEPDWVEAKTHSYIPTKDAPADKPDDRKWRPQMDATCRYTETEDGTLYADCYICDNVRVKKNGKENQKPFPATRLFAIAVERERVEATQEHVDAGLCPAGQIGSEIIVDQVTDREIDGKRLRLPKFVLLNYGFKNFFDKLLGAQNVYGTVADRDFAITRLGEGTDTDYEITPLDAQLDKDGNRIDSRRSPWVDIYSCPDPSKTWVDVMTELVLSRASDEYYGFFFDPSQNITWAQKYPKQDDAESNDSPAATSDSKPAAQQEATQREPANQDALAAMRSRMTQRN